MSLLFDESILHGFFGANDSQKTCIPGDKLYSAADGYCAGSGCYEFHGSIFASLAGFVYAFPSTVGGTDVNVVEVRRNFDKKCQAVPFQGSIVTARVDAITLKFAKCSIICVGESLLPHEFNSTLRKEDIQEHEKDKVEIYRCVQPGDLIIARVLGYGDHQTAYLLSVAEDELGVIVAKGQNGEQLVPSDSKTVKSTTVEYREERKVASIPSPFI